MPALPRPRLALLLLLAASGCSYHYVRDYCPTCVVVERGVAPVQIRDGARLGVILVPGILGFEWEWDRPLALLRARADTFVQVYHWRPSSGLGTVAEELAAVVDRVIAEAPDSLERLLIVGHSAGGMVTAHAAARIRTRPEIPVDVLNVGAPYAGLHASFLDLDDADFLYCPFMLALGYTFERYPPIAPGVTVESYVTDGNRDPVMKVRWGHDPGKPTVGPAGRRRLVPPQIDHNHALGWAIDLYLARFDANPPPPRDQCVSLSASRGVASSTRSRPPFLAR